MGRTIWSAVILSAILGISGCTTVDSDAQVEEAMRLVEQQSGRRPAWLEEWDTAEPVWDGRTVLELDEALVLALRNNRELRADLELIGQANAELVQAGLMSNPVISFMIMFPDGGGRSMLRGNGLPMQPLQDLWLIPARKEVATRQLQAAILRVADRAVRLAAQVKVTYARLQYAQRAIELMRSNIEVVDQSTRIIKVRQSSGQATQVEVNLSQIRSLRQQSELMAMESEYRAMQRELLMLMGLAGATDGWRVSGIDELADAVDAPPEEAALLELVEEQRLDLRAADWSVQAAERNIELNRREGWPELAVGFGLERSAAPRASNQRLIGKLGNAAAQGVADGIAGMPSSGAPAVAPFTGPKARDVTWMLGPMVDLEVPIFDQNQARVARAVHEYRQRVAEFEALLHEIVQRVRIGRVRVMEAFRQVRFYREQIVPSVERNLQVAERSYVAGREGLTVFLETQEDLLMTRLRMLQFYRDYLVSRAELERQVGGAMVLQRLASTRPAGDGEGAESAGAASTRPAFPEGD